MIFVRNNGSSCYPYVIPSEYTVIYPMELRILVLLKQTLVLSVCSYQCVLISVFLSVCSYQCVLISVFLSVCSYQCVLISVFLSVCSYQCVLISVFLSVCSS